MTDSMLVFPINYKCNMFYCRFWWAKLKGLTDVANFEELEKFSKQKKSPIGYEVIYVFCLSHFTISLL